MKRLLLATVCVVAGCNSIPPDMARDPRGGLIGQNITDVLPCAGVPSQAIANGPDAVLLQWDQPAPANASPWISIPLPSGLGAPLKASFGEPASCHMIVEVLNSGVISTVEFSGPGIGDSEHACAGMVLACIARPNVRPMPRGFNARDLLTVIRPRQLAQ